MYTAEIRKLNRKLNYVMRPWSTVGVGGALEILIVLYCSKSGFNIHVQIIFSLLDIDSRKFFYIRPTLCE